MEEAGSVSRLNSGKKKTVQKKTSCRRGFTWVPLSRGCIRNLYFFECITRGITLQREKNIIFNTVFRYFEFTWPE